MLGIVQVYGQDQAGIANLRAAYELYRAQDNEADERHELSAAVLAAVRSSASTDPATRAQAARLLAREHEEAGEVPPNPPVRPVRELAGAMLALRLG